MIPIVGDQFIGWEIDGFVDNDPTTAGGGRCVEWARSLNSGHSPRHRA